MIKLSKSEEEKALALHSKAIVVDSLNAMFPEDVRRRRNKGERSVMEKQHIPRLRSGGIDAVVTTMAWAGLPWPTPVRVLQNIGYMYSEFDESPDKITLATTVEDVERAKKEGKTAIFFGLQNAQSVVGEPEGDFTLLKIFYRLGVRFIIPCYNERNMFGDGCYEAANAGLSNLGVKLIEEMNKLGIVVDLSHVGQKTFMDALEVTKYPPVASHSNARSLVDHRRNLTDEQIKALAEKGGVIGLNAWKYLVGKATATIENLLDHCDYMVKLVGANHIGLGLDFFEYAADTLEQYFHYIPGKSYIPGGEFSQGIESEEQVPNITKGLVARGYSDEEILGILGGNFLKVWKQIIK